MVSINTLQFLLPNLGREMLIYWNSKAGKSSVIDTETMFQDGNDEPDHNNDNEEENGTTMTHPTARNLSVEDEYLLVLMKLKMGLSEIDLGERFSVTSSTVNNVFLLGLTFFMLHLGVSRYGLTKIFYKAHLGSSLINIQIALLLLMLLN